MRKTSLVVAVIIGTGLFGCTKSKVSGPPQEKVFRVGIESKITNLDPHSATDVYSITTASLVYESLYEFHYLKHGELTPVLAESLPVFSKDRKKMTITLRKGVHFQDDPCFVSTGGKGPELTSADVVYYFNRIAAPKFLNSNYGSFEGRIVGIDDFHAGKASSISGVKAIDKYTVEISLTQALPRFIYNFVDAHGAILPKECVETLGDKLATHPVGTGPFKIQEANLGSKVVVVRNPNYHHGFYPKDGKPGDAEQGLLADAGKPIPFVDKVVFEVIVEQQPNWLKFKSGEFEFAAIPKDFIPGELPNNTLSEGLRKLGVQHFQGYRGDVTLQIFNLDDPVWGKSKDLRHAFALALDSNFILAKQYEGQAIRAQSIVEPNQYGYDPKFRSKWEKRDVAKAKDLLAKAGYPEGKGLPPLNQPSNDGTLGRQFDEMITRQLAEAGIVLKPEPMTWPEFDKRIRNQNFTVIGLGESSSVPDFDDAIGLLHSKFAPSGQNIARYRNAEVDKILDDIERLDNGPERLAKIQKVREIIDEDLPYVPIAHRIGHVFYQKWVHNGTFVDRARIGSAIKFLRVETATEAK